MKFSCDSCNAQYMIADEKVGARGVKVKCKKCSHIIIVKPAAREETPAPNNKPAATDHSTAASQKMSATTANTPASAESNPAFNSSSNTSNPFGSVFSAAGTSANEGAGSDSAGMDAGIVGGTTSNDFGSSSFQNAGFGSSASSFDTSPSMPDLAAESAANSSGMSTSPYAATDNSQRFSANANFSSSSQSYDNSQNYQSEGSDFDLGALSPNVRAPSQVQQSPGEKEWYIAIDDSQIGPIDLAEVEQRWDAEELDEESLAWKAGMADWLPLTEIPELTYLITQRPHTKSQARANFSSAAANTATASSTGTIMVPSSGVTFGGETSDEEISWKPSAASALSSLVQEELVAANNPPSPAPVASASNNPYEMDMPSFGANELFSSKSNSSSRASVAAVAPRVDSFGGAPMPSWSVPVTPKHTSHAKWMIPLFSFFGLAILGLLGFLVWQQMHMPKQVIVQAPIQSNATNAVSDNTKSAGSKAVAANVDNTKKPAADDDDSEASSDKANGKASTKGEGRRKNVLGRNKNREPRGAGKHETTTRADDDEDSPRPTPRANPKSGSRDPLADIDTPSNKPAAKESLTKQDVMSAVKRSAATVAPCLKDARANNEIQPGKVVFTLNWVIRPDGSVARPVMKGPANVLNTSLPSCFSTVMKRWRFPASQRELPISNFPFGPITIH